MNTFGLVPIYEILKQNKNESERLYDLYIIPMDNYIESLKFANELRQKGLKVIIEFNKKKVSKAFNWASKNNIPYVETNNMEEYMSELDVLYMTRVQKERFFNEEDYKRLKDYYILTKDKLQIAKKGIYGEKYSYK